MIQKFPLVTDIGHAGASVCVHLDCASPTVEPIIQRFSRTSTKIVIASESRQTNNLSLFTNCNEAIIIVTQFVNAALG